MKKITDDWSACRIEKLTKFRYDTPAEPLYTGFHRLAHGYGTTEKGIQEIKDKYLLPQSLVDLAPLLQACRKAAGVEWDLHSGNVMMRGDTLVVTDPFYGTSAF